MRLSGILLGLVGGAVFHMALVDAQPPERQVVTDNDTVRVVLLTFSPGIGTGRHMGIEPELGIVLEGEMTLDTAKGREDLRPGSVYWVPGMIPHDLRNSSSRPAKVWDILLKRCW